MSGLDAYLSELADRAAGRADRDVVLWPRTPIDAQRMQEIIAGRVGAADAQTLHPRSRSYRIAAIASALADLGLVAPDATVIDIACGDALIVTHVQRTRPALRCHGVDLYLDAFPSHALARAAGVRLWRVLLQDLFAQAPPRPVDLAVMLNTYRGWENADLRDDERGLPALADAWFDAGARWIAMTMRGEQVGPWRRRGYRALDWGSGEDDSRLVLLTRERVPPRLRVAAAAVRLRAARAQPLA